MQNDPEQYSAKETEQRLQKILQGAFSGAPTPLKDIPTRRTSALAEWPDLPEVRITQALRDQKDWRVSLCCFVVSTT
jgi:hypothetical protein